MRKKIYKWLLLIGLVIPVFSFAQQKIELKQCREWARDNYPKLKQTEILKSIADLKNENLKVNYLPQIDLKGQATYQSNVIEFNLPIPNFKMDPLSRDQYKVYLDVKQTIWDGGITKSQKSMELAGLETDLQRLELDVYQLYKLVEAYYFNVLLIDKNLEVLATQNEVLALQVERLQNAIKNGAARQKELWKLEAEQLQLNQKVSELKSAKQSIVKVLGVITGKGFSDETNFEKPIVVKANQNEFLRPEMKLFDLQRYLISTGNQLLNATRNPLFYGFGQAGYGKPGLNMLNNKFDPYYIVGVGLSWRISDWSTTHRKLQINDEQNKTIATVQSDFLQKQQVQLVDAEEQINKINQLIQTDAELVKLRKSIAATAASELENGTVTATDYLVDLNAQTVAQINSELHKVQLVQATVNYNSILGY